MIVGDFFRFYFINFCKNNEFLSSFARKMQELGLHSRYNGRKAYPPRLCACFAKDANDPNELAPVLALPLLANDPKVVPLESMPLLGFVLLQAAKAANPVAGAMSACTKTKFEHSQKIRSERPPLF